jgi:hypothetical protein
MKVKSPDGTIYHFKNWKHISKHFFYRYGWELIEDKPKGIRIDERIHEIEDSETMKNHEENDTTGVK